MAQIKIQHSCGCERIIETPGPEDPQGLLSKLAAVCGAVHRTPAKCSNCAPLTLTFDMAADAGLPSAEDLDLVAAEQDLQTNANDLSACAEASAAPEGSEDA